MVPNPYAASQQFMAAGYSVLPIKLDGSKAPAVPWKPFTERFANAEELQQWFQNDQFGIAVSCGTISGNLEVIDVDDTSLTEAYEQIVDRACPGLLDRVITIKTPRDGGKGRQYWYRLPYDPPGHEDLARGMRPGADGQQAIKTLIETRSAGNYVVAPGSPVAVHSQGLPYEFIRGPLFSQLGPITKLEHGKLLAAARLFNELEVDRGEHCTLEREPYSGPPRPGDVFNQSVEWRDLLQHFQWTEVSENYWRRPGKDSGGYSAVLGHFSDDQDQPLLSVFSRNAGALAPAADKDVRVVSKFDVLAQLQYGGDYSAAALAITEDERYRAALERSQREYYGSQTVSTGNETMQGTWLSDVEEKPIDWLWPGRFAAGFFHLVCGDPGIGKSMLMIDITARVTTGRCWPDQSDCIASPGSVFILTAEDTLAHSVKPRLRLAGADMSKVRGFSGFVRRDSQLTSFSLRTDLEHLARHLAAVPDCRLVVIDPLSAFLGAEDSHKNADVRAALHPLTSFLEDHGITLIAIEHLNKDSRNDIQYRISGSIGIAAAARATWYTFRDPEDSDRILFLQGKINFAQTQKGLAYRIIQAPGENLPVLHWEPNPIDMTAADYRAVQKATQQDICQNWLRTVLPASRADVLRLGEQLGFSASTVQRAFAGIDGISERKGFPAAAYWRLPEGAAVESTDSTGDRSTVESQSLYPHADSTGQLGEKSATHFAHSSPASCPVESRCGVGNPDRTAVESVDSTGIVNTSGGDGSDDGCDWEVIPCST